MPPQTQLATSEGRAPRPVSGSAEDRWVSVVIPTFNRRDTLPEVIDAVLAQVQVPPFEVIVVDDGSSDGTSELADRFVQDAANGGPPVRWLRQENQGPAAARNRGVAAAKGDLVAFLGDDTVPSSGWLAAHLAARERRAAELSRHEGKVVGTIGYTGWHERTGSNRFLRYINEYGLQFGYALIEDHDDVPFNFLYTSNLVMPRSALVQHPFDLSFPYAAWEDIELAYRVQRAVGLHLLYEPAARTRHDHPTNLDRFCARQEKAGYCAVVFYRLHPELGGFLGIGAEGPPPIPPLGRQRRLRVLARALQKLDLGWPALWEEVLRFHYIVGLHRGLKDHPS